MRFIVFNNRIKMQPFIIQYVAKLRECVLHSYLLLIPLLIYGYSLLIRQNHFISIN